MPWKEESYMFVFLATAKGKAIASLLTLVVAMLLSVGLVGGTASASNDTGALVAASVNGPTAMSTAQPGDLFPSSWTMDGLAASTASIGGNEVIQGVLYIVLGLALIVMFFLTLKRLVGKRR
jgi:hypothetical protein